MKRPSLTPAQIEFINSGNHEIDFELTDFEVLAIYSLGQMQNKIVRLTDNFWGKTKVGLFVIDHINEKQNPDFKNANDWKSVSLSSISLTLITPNEWGGENTDTYSSIFDIKEIALLKQ